MYKKRHINSFLILDDTNKVVISVLAFFGIKATRLNFFVGYLRSKDNSSLYINNINISRVIATNIIDELTENKKISFINNKFGRSTVRLFFIKYFFQYVQYWVVRILISQSISSNNLVTIWLPLPLFFNQYLLKQSFPEVRIQFYGNNSISMWLSLIKKYLYGLLKEIKLKYSGFFAANYISNNTKPSILSMQEDTIRADIDYRSQLYWALNENIQASFNTFILYRDSKSFRVLASKESLMQNNTTLLDYYKVISIAFRHHKNHKKLSEIKKAIKFIRKSYLTKGSLKEKYILILLHRFMVQAQLIGSLAIFLNTKIFLVKETYYQVSDDIQLIAKDVGVTTIACQYSNLGLTSPLMVSPCVRIVVR